MKLTPWLGDLHSPQPPSDRRLWKEGGRKGLQREEVTPEWASGVQVGVEAGRMERPRREGVGLSETASPLGLKTALLAQMRRAQSLLRAGWQAGPGDPSRILICHLSLQLLWQY